MTKRGRIMAERNGLFIYEALELRSEYDGRLETLRSCLPETRRTGRASLLSRIDADASRPAAGVDAGALRTELRTLEHKRHKLNAAIQRANFANSVRIGDEEVSLTEALELRKAAKMRVGELSTQLANSSAARVIHKEDRDIIEEPEVPFPDVRNGLEQARLEFRRLKRALRKATFEVSVDFADEATT
jgi:hypothetical protein